MKNLINTITRIAMVMLAIVFNRIGIRCCAMRNADSPIWGLEIFWDMGWTEKFIPQIKRMKQINSIINWICIATGFIGIWAILETVEFPALIVYPEFIGACAVLAGIMLIGIIISNKLEKSILKQLTMQWVLEELIAIGIYFEDNATIDDVLIRLEHEFWELDEGEDRVILQTYIDELNAVK
jgi:hypothetical protein